MIVVRVLLQCGFMITHSPACCSSVGVPHMCHSRAPWVTYIMCTHIHTQKGSVGWQGAKRTIYTPVDSGGCSWVPGTCWGHVLVLKWSQLPLSS